MPTISAITLEDLNVGPAADFRTTANSNFDAIEAKFTEVINALIDIQLSSTTPTNQKANDIWLKVLS